MISYFKKILKNFVVKKNSQLICFRNNTFRLNDYYKSMNIADGSTIYNTTLSGIIDIGKEGLINNSIIRGQIKIGNYTSINGPTTFICSKHNPISIGNYCSIAHNVTIIEYLHNIDKLSTCFLNKKRTALPDASDSWSKGEINIGHDVWIGTGSVILSGVKIGHGAIIGANSVITKDVPDYAIVVGNPGKIVRYRFNKSIINKLLNLKWFEFDKHELTSLDKLLNEELSHQVLEKIEEILHANNK